MTKVIAGEVGVAGRHVPDTCPSAPLLPPRCSLRGHSQHACSPRGCSAILEKGPHVMVLATAPRRAHPNPSPLAGREPQASDGLGVGGCRSLDSRPPCTEKPVSAQERLNPNALPLLPKLLRGPPPPHLPPGRAHGTPNSVMTALAQEETPLPGTKGKSEAAPGRQTLADSAEVHVSGAPGRETPSVSSSVNAQTPRPATPLASHCRLSTLAAPHSTHPPCHPALSSPPACPGSSQTRRTLPQALVGGRGASTSASITPTGRPGEA